MTAAALEQPGVSAWNVSLKGDGRVAHSLRCGCVVKKSLRRQRSVRGRHISKLDVCLGSGYPNETMPWIREIELAKSINNLKTSVSNTGWSNPSFETRDARIAIAYGRKITWDDVQGFDTKCDTVLLTMCKMRIRGPEELKTVLTLHESIRRTLSQAIRT